MPLDFAPFPTGHFLPLPSSPCTTEQFLAVLHPASARGTVSVMLADGDRMHTRTYRPCELDAVAGVLVEAESSYITLNRSHGPRGRSKIAALNAVWLDLDVHRVPDLAHRARPEVEAIIRNRIAEAGLPGASFLVDSGFGYHAIWLIQGAAPAALPRWSALMRALVQWARPLGADPACTDAARVLRLPGSWHAGAGKQVTVIDGTAVRHDFEAFAAAVWRATGRPTRRDLDDRRSRRALRTMCPVGTAMQMKPRGLSRRAFWSIALDDLERLRDSWGGSVPTGLRDLWLHLWVTALGWTAVETDLAECAVAKAGIAAPGLSTREIRRMMSATIRRAEQAAAGRRGPTGRDVRYDYRGARMAELLGVDRASAEMIGLRQIVPTDLRADRRRANRTARRRAAGVMPRSIWLAANPIERERPWQGEGISRATWYRRLAKARDLRRRAHLAGLLAGVASDPLVLSETGPGSQYRGVAQPSASPRRPEAPKPAILSEKLAMPPKTPAHPMPAPKIAQKRAEPADPVSARTEASQSPAKASANPYQEHPRMPLIDPDVLALASRQLTAPDLGNLTRIAIALVAGPTDRFSLGWRLKLDFDELERIGCWLRIAADDRTVVGLTEPPAEPTRVARKPRQGALFDEAEFVPPPTPRQPSSIKEAVIHEAIPIMVPAGVTGPRVRAILGRLFRDHGVGLVAEAIHELSRIEVVPDPVAWIQGCIRKRKPLQASAATSAQGRRNPAAAPAARPERPLATPEYLGISPGRAAQIREQNRKLKLIIKS